MDRVVFVTVGTTRFEALIRAVDSVEVLRALREKGYTRVVVQIGQGQYEPFGGAATAEGLALEWYRLKPSIAGDMERASLVISHGGYGSLMESLTLRKNVIAVINDQLMGNHQVDIAFELQRQGCAVACSPDTLASTIASTDFSLFAKLEPAQPTRIASHIDSLMQVN